MAKLSITDARGYFDLVVKASVERFLDDDDDFQKGFAAARDLYHFHEWLWKYHSANIKAEYPTVQKKGDFWHKIIEVMVKDSGLLRDLTNISKHVELSVGQGNRQAPSTTMHYSANVSIQVYGSVPGQPDKPKKVGHIRLAEGNRSVLLSDLAKRMMAFYKKRIDNYFPPPAPPVIVTGPATPRANT
jgi:hypothetical protein